MLRATISPSTSASMKPSLRATTVVVVSGRKCDRAFTQSVKLLVPQHLLMNAACRCRSLRLCRHCPDYRHPGLRSPRDDATPAAPIEPALFALVRLTDYLTSRPPDYYSKTVHQLIRDGKVETKPDIKSMECFEIARPRW